MKTRFLTILTCIVLLSCSTQDSDCDPDIYCDTVPYDYGYIDVKLTYNGVGIPIILYKGYLEDNVILEIDTAYGDLHYFYQEVGERYAVEAYYPEAGNTVIALDGGKLVQDDFYNCGDRCYNEPTLDLDLKKI